MGAIKHNSKCNVPTGIIIPTPFEWQNARYVTSPFTRGHFAKTNIKHQWINNHIPIKRLHLLWQHTI